MAESKIVSRKCQAVIDGHETYCRNSCPMLRGKDRYYIELHISAWESPRAGLERGLRTLLVGYAQFADGFATYQGDDYRLGDCGYFGPHAADMIKALNAALSLERGRFDGGLLSHLIGELATASGIETEL